MSYDVCKKFISKAPMTWNTPFICISIFHYCFYIWKFNENQQVHININFSTRWLNIANIYVECRILIIYVILFEKTTYSNAIYHIHMPAINIVFRYRRTCFWLLFRWVSFLLQCYRRAMKIDRKTEKHKNICLSNEHTVSS